MPDATDGTNRGDHFSPSQSTGRSVLVGGIWNNVGTIVPLAINLGLTPYAIHGFGVSRWGLYVLISALSLFLSPLGGGAAPSVGRFFSLYAATGDRDKTTRTLYTALVATVTIGVIITAVTWFVAPPLIGIFGASRELAHEGVFMLRTLGLVVAAGLSHQMFASLVNSHQRYALTNITNCTSYCVWAAGIIISVHWHYGLQGAALAVLAQQIVNTASIVPNSLRYFNTRPAFLSWADTKELLRFAGSIQGMSLITLINQQFDSILIGGIFTLPDLTYFNTGANFAQQLRGLATNFLQPGGVHLARTFGSRGPDATEAEFQRLQTVWVIGVSGFSTAVLASCYFAVVAWLGPSFTLAGEVAVIAMAGNTINLWTGMLTQYMAAVGRPDLELRYAVVSVVVNVGLTIPLALVGPLGVGAATVLGMVVSSFYLIRIVRKHYRTDVPNFLADVPYVASAVAGAVTVGLELALRPIGWQGPVGLLLCGIPALIGMGVFAAVVLRSHLRDIVGLVTRGQLRPATLLEMLVPGPMGQPTAPKAPDAVQR